uniref:Mediator of RNA polymerase II transcription subunit 15 n=1 Tax=Strongyloides venezuelensis TaxID=75913 RepID=A0A0K0FC52_STRVS
MNYGSEQQQNISGQYVMQRVPQRIAPMAQSVPNQQRPQGQVISNQPQMVGQQVITNGQRQTIQMGQGVPQGYYMQIQQNEPMQIGNQERRQVPVQYDQRQNLMRQRMVNNQGAQMIQQQQAQQIRMRTNINTGVNQPQIVYLQQGPNSVPTQMSNANSNAPIQLQRISSAHYQQANQSSGSPMNIQQQTNYHNAGQNLNHSPPQVPVMYNNATTSGPSPQYGSALQAELRGTVNNQSYQQHKMPHQNMMNSGIPQHVQSAPQLQKELETDKESPEYINRLNHFKQHEKKLKILFERLRLDGGNEKFLNNIEKILDIIEGKKIATLQFLEKLEKTVENLIEKYDICMNMIKTSTMVAEEADNFKSFTIPHYDPFYSLKKYHSRMPKELRNIVPDDDPTPYYLRKNYQSQKEEDNGINDSCARNIEKELDEYFKLAVDENDKQRLVIICDNGRAITISNEATKELLEIGNFEIDREAIPISDHCREVRIKITGSDTSCAFPLYLIIPVDYPETLCTIYYPFESPNNRNRYLENIKRNMEINLARNSYPRTITEIASRWSTEVNNCFIHDWSFNGPTQNSVG